MDENVAKQRFVENQSVAKDILKKNQGETGLNLEQNKDILSLSMTVCIAAVAEDGKKAVLIADKLVTTTGILPYQTDMAADKIVKINDNVSVMYCGGITDASVIIEDSLKNIGQNKWIGEIANHINQKHLEYLTRILTRLHLTTRDIQSPNEFYNNYIPLINTQIGKDIDTALTTHNLLSNTQFIVCGKENDGLYRIYYLGINPRFVPNLMTINYSTIGSGAGHANFAMIQSKYNKSASAKDVQELLIKAKKSAENDQNVGINEDIMVME